MAVVGDALVAHAGLPIDLLRRVAALALRRGETLAETLHRESNRAFLRGWQRFNKTILSRAYSIEVGDFDELLECSSDDDGAHPL